MTDATDIMEERWRYMDRSGRIMWLAFNPGFLCVYCEQPVGALSTGGPAVCPSCDCGNNRDGSKWTSDDFYRQARNANRRFDTMPDDPLWEKYEAGHKLALSDREGK